MDFYFFKVKIDNYLNFLKYKMDFNELIYDSVKKFVSAEKDNILVKICTGNATEEEKKNWQTETGISDEVVDKLKEVCDTGYNMASEMDKQSSNDVSLSEKVEKLEEELEKQKQNFEEELEKQKQNFEEELKEQKRNFEEELKEQKEMFTKNLEEIKKQMETLNNEMETFIEKILV